jgi:hypothetical protein
VTFASPEGLADLALEPRAFNDRDLIEPWIYSGSAQPSPAIDAPACDGRAFRVAGASAPNIRRAVVSAPPTTCPSWGNR